MTRSEAWDLLCDYTKGESLRKHALAVECAVVAYAKKFGEDEEKWSVTALLHDFDYEQFPDPTPPDGHPYKGSEILKSKGVSEEIRKRFCHMPIIPAFRVRPNSKRRSLRATNCAAS